MTDNNVTQLPLAEESIEVDEPVAVEVEQPAEYHSLLEVWRKVLEPVEGEAKKKPSLQWAIRLVSQYPLLTFKDIPELADLYYARVLEMRHIVDAEIASDASTLSVASAEEDCEENSTSYLNVLMLWQQQVLAWELDWDPSADNAAVDLATISEVHQMFLGETGLTAHLDSINFQFTEDDKEQLTSVLNEQREAALAG